jgi:hypothetical protein
MSTIPSDPKPLGNPAPFAEPAWLNFLASPYYNASDRKVHRAVREHLEEHVFPYVKEWEENSYMLLEARRHNARAGLAFQEMPLEYAEGVGLLGVVSFEE